MDVYTDGAYSSARNLGGVGLVFVKDDEIIYKYSKCIPNTTNNRCELYAVIKALQALSDGVKELNIYLDCLYENEVEKFDCFKIIYKVLPKIK